MLAVIWQVEIVEEDKEALNFFLFRQQFFY